ncbi:MAG: LacI family DNA-binding transcriptional regulator [Candidatus Acidiferrales bacterium]
MAKRATVYDIADALGISAGTVHRALHDYAGVNPATKKRVLQMAKTLGYRPNLAARYLSQKRKLLVSINTLKGTTSFWDEVRAGVEEEAKSLDMEGVEVQFRTYPSLGEGDEEAFEAALEAKADGIITFPSRPGNMRKWIRRASRSKVPVICVVTDAPNTGRLAVVSIDTLASGSLAADLLGKFLQGQGRVAVTMSALVITEHAEKFNAFKSTLQKFYPAMQLEDAIEDHDIEAEAYEKSKELFSAHPDLAGLYITTEASIPVIQAARDANILEKLTIITTDLFPALVEEIRKGSVSATIYQRPRTQGRMAYRVLHEFLTEGECSAYQVTFSPHLVMRGNLEFFLQGQSFEAASRKNGHPASAASHSPGAKQLPDH